MKRIISLWLPTLATDRIAHRAVAKPPEAGKDKPLVTAEGARGRLVVVGANEPARTHGIAPTMALADARALVPGLDVRAADPEGDAAALERLATWGCRYTPWVALEAGTSSGTGGLWLDVSGCTHLFGGEAALLEDMSRRLQHFGFAVRGALADTPGSAWAWARFGDANNPILPPDGAKDALGDLPVAALRLAPDIVDTLDRLGLRRIATLYDLPRAALAARLGTNVRRRIDQLLGSLAEPISPQRPTAPFTARLAFPEPVGRPTDIEAALERLLGTLCVRLEAEHLGARRIAFTVHRSDNSSDEVSAGTSRPARDPRHLMRLLAPKLEHLDPAGPDGHSGVEVAVLTFPAVASFKAGQRAMPRIAASAHGHTRTQTPTGELALKPRSVHGEPDLAALADRLAGRLGVGNVRTLALRESHWPERAAVARPVLDGPMPDRPALDNPPSTNAAARSALPRPLRLLERPEPVEIEMASEANTEDLPTVFRWRTFAHEVTRAEGPERIAPEWWLELGARNPSAARDYYRIEDRAGRRFWLYREVGGTPARWFLHGQFG